MKTRIKIMAMLTFLLISNYGFSNTEKPVFILKKEGDKTIHFDAKEMLSSFLEVTIRDKSGDKMFSEYAIHPADFERKYNLSELKNGLYFLEVKFDKTTQILPISITDKGLEMEWEDLETM
ncbi:MAG: hypothetical protein AB8F94_13200 [Saprospiraceae bacterium]